MTEAQGGWLCWLLDLRMTPLRLDLGRDLLHEFKSEAGRRLCFGCVCAAVGAGSGEDGSGRRCVGLLLRWVSGRRMSQLLPCWLQIGGAVVRGCGSSAEGGEGATTERETGDLFGAELNHGWWLR